MKALLDWIDRRTGLLSAVRGHFAQTVPGGARWGNIWPSAILFAFFVQMATGFFLWMFYSPSAQTAWESVYFLQYEVLGGWLLRGIHHWSAQVLVVLMGLYLIRMVLVGAYRSPREFVFWTAFVMGLFSLGLCLTGDLLAWDQNSYAATMVRTKFLALLPGIGAGLFKLAAGGPAFGHLTLTRFFALHVGLFAGGFLVLLLLHGWLLRRAASLEAPQAEHGSPYWPNQAIRNAVACVAVLVVVGLLVFQHALGGDHAGQPPGDYLGIELGAPADPDPANFYAAARPEWSFRGVYEVANTFPGELKIVPIFVIPTLLVLLLLAMPLIGYRTAGHVFNVVLLAVLLTAMAALTVLSYRHDLHNPDHQRAIAVAEKEAARAKQLARGGIPAAGALWLLRNDPVTQGPKLCSRLCAMCHNYGAPGEEAITTEEPTAPDLYNFASRQWIAGLLDAKQIKTAKYFGNTKLRGGEMVAFVEELYEKPSDEEMEELREELGAIAAALSAEARLPSQHEMDKEDAQLIERGKQLLVDDYGCTDCHRFHGEGERNGPELTGYGSPEWIAGIIGNPRHKRFYGDGNDRMPSYLEFPDRPRKNLLTAGQVDLLSRWLRGDDSINQAHGLRPVGWAK